MLQTPDKDFITHVYNKFWKELYVVAYRRLRSEEDVEDMLQDLFISLIDNRVSLESDYQVRAFLHKRLKSRIIDFYRKELVKSAFEVHENRTSEVSDMQSDTRLLYGELGALVQNEICNMPEKMKEIFLLSREEQLSNEEIAKQLNLSNQTVRNQVSTALKRIRTAVEQYRHEDLQPVSLQLLITIAAMAVHMNTVNIPIS